MKYTFTDYIQELVEEFGEASADFAVNPDDKTETALAEIGEMLYNATELRGSEMTLSTKASNLLKTLEIPWKSF